MKSIIKSAFFCGVLTLASLGAEKEAQAYDQRQGTYCREYTKTVTIGRKRTEAYGTACMQGNGQWEIVSASNPEVYDDPGSRVILGRQAVVPNYYPQQVVYTVPVTRYVYLNKPVYPVAYYRPTKWKHDSRWDNHRHHRGHGHGHGRGWDRHR